MIIKNINFANVAFLESAQESNMLEGFWLPMSDNVYIEQFSKDHIIPTKYQDSKHFVKLAQLSKKEIDNIKSKYSNFSPVICTASMFVDQNGNEIVSSAQDMSKHILENPGDKLCTRELKKERGLIKSGEGYDSCPGCDTANHSEPNAINKAIQANKYDQLSGSTLYLFNHFWCCDSCREKLALAGVAKIVINPHCDWVFGNKHVQWYRDNDLI